MIRWTERLMWPQKRRSRERSSICFGWPGLKTFLSQWIQKYYEILLGFVLSWSLNQCPGSTKLLAKASSRTITFSLLLEPSAASSTALEGSSMESSWTGFILTHAFAYFYLLFYLFYLLFSNIFNLQDKLPDSNGCGDGPVDNTCIHSLYHFRPWQGKRQYLFVHMLLNKELGQIADLTNIWYVGWEHVRLRLGSPFGSGQSMQLSLEPTQPSLRWQHRLLGTSKNT